MFNVIINGRRIVKHFESVSLVPGATCDRLVSVRNLSPNFFVVALSVSALTIKPSLDASATVLNLRPPRHHNMIRLLLSSNIQIQPLSCRIGN
uniref:MSP domain-containing protein n=1 Tax=Steinernema glaseri TaxID=37863 RepID=A0A1I8AAY0_9BILA